MKRKERVIREIGSCDVGESHPESTRCPLGRLDGFPRYLRFLALPAVDGKTLRHLQTWIDATQPTSDVVSKLVENRMRSLKRVSRQLETRLDERALT